MTWQSSLLQKKIVVPKLQRSQWKFTELRPSKSQLHQRQSQQQARWPGHKHNSLEVIKQSACPFCTGDYMWLQHTTTLALQGSTLWIGTCTWIGSLDPNVPWAAQSSSTPERPMLCYQLAMGFFPVKRWQEASKVFLLSDNECQGL